PEFLYRATRGRDVGIKQLLMNANVMVGVGNIYANESLFRAGIHPRARSGSLSRARCERLVSAVRDVLLAAIAAGGSSLRDFVRSDGSPGYFQQNYYVYDRAALPCRVCGAAIRVSRAGQRSSFVWLAAIPTTTSPTSAAARRTKSSWPRVIGSNVPGYTALIIELPRQKMKMHVSRARASENGPAPGRFEGGVAFHVHPAPFGEK